MSTYHNRSAIRASEVLLTGKLGYTLCLAAFLSVSLAQASTITYELNVDGCSGAGCGNGPFGWVKLDDTGTLGTVTVTVTLADHEVFAGGGAGDALAFNIKSTASSGLAITPLDTTNFELGPAPDHTSAFGTFTNSVTCKTCQGGQAGNSAGPLVFTVTSSTPGVSLTDFVTNNKNYYFSSDIAVLSPTGTRTGVVATAGPGTTGSVPTVPEPTTILLSLGGFGLVGLARARKFLSF